MSSSNQEYGYRVVRAGCNKLLGEAMASLVDPRAPRGTRDLAAQVYESVAGVNSLILLDSAPSVSRNLIELRKILRARGVRTA